MNTDKLPTREQAENAARAAGRNSVSTGTMKENAVYEAYMACYNTIVNSATPPDTGMKWVRVESEKDLPEGYDCYRVLNPQFTEKVLQMYAAEQLPIVEGYYEFNKQGAAEKLKYLKPGYTLELLSQSPDPWIRVQDDLPEDYQYVLCYSEINGFAPTNEGISKYTKTYGFESVPNVIAWMPLPPKPKEI